MSSSQKPSQYNKLQKQLKQFFHFSRIIHHHDHSQSKKYNISFFLLIVTSLFIIFLFFYQYINCNPIYTVAIIGTNDLHGKVFPTILIRNDTKQSYKYGGLVYMASMIQTIKKQYNNNVLYFDAGDQYQGGIQASKFISNGTIMNDFFSIAGLNGSSIGNHQFDFGPDFLIQFLKGRNTPNLAANLQSQNNQPNFLPHQKGSHIYTLPNGIKIGVIGLSTVETPITSSGFTSRLFPRYKFLNYKQSVIKHATILKSQGVNAILIVSHIGDPCNSDLKYAIRTQTIQQLQQSCPPDELTQLIDQLPAGIIDGIIQGHRHKTAHQYYRNIPYMGSINGGYYFNVMYLKFDYNKKLVGINIQSPIAVCQKIFTNRKRCDYVPQNELPEAGQLVNWQFHNTTVVAHPQLNSLLTSKYFPKMLPYYKPLCQNDIYLYRKQYQQSQLANLITSLMHIVTPDANFTLINTGTFRTQWRPGTLQEQHFYNMFPFQNQLQTFQITGKQLKQLLTILQSTGKRFIQAHGLVMQININNKNPKNNTYKLLSLQFQNNKQIQQQKVYKGSTLSYLLQGGDIFDRVPVTQFKNITDVGDFRQIIKKQLIKLKIITKDKVINPNKPRIILKHNNDI